MRRLLTFLNLLLLVASCTKEADISPSCDSSSGAVKFTVSVVDITKSCAALKDSWVENDEIAIFINDEENVHRYTVAEDGTLSGDEIIKENGESNTYTAYYPYDLTLGTIGDYELMCGNGYVDYLKAEITSSEDVVNLQFNHQLAALSFSITVNATITNPSMLLALDGDLNNTIPLEFGSSIGSVASLLEANYFVVDGTDISSTILVYEQDDYKGYYYIKPDDSSIVEAGNHYHFSFEYGNLNTGTGSADDPHIIYTADDMLKVGTGTDSWDLDSHYLLAWDIDLESTEFKAIGSATAPFTGTFNGEGYNIALYIDESDSDYQGVFGYISGATITNLSVSGSVSGSNYVGGIVGYMDNNSEINNSYNAASISASNDNVGGVAGYMDNSSKISECYNMALISGSSHIGGIAGNMNSYSDISYCYNAASISASSYSGGIAGGIYDDSKVSYCYNVGSISGTSNIGGIAGGFSSYATLSYLFYDYATVSGVSGAIDNSNSGVKYNYLSTANMKGTASSSGTLLYYFTNSSYGGSDEWTSDTYYINSGYPILTWQTSYND